MKTKMGHNCRYRALAILCAAVLAVAQCCFVVPILAEHIHGAIAGKELDIVVHYYGGSVENGLVKKTYSADELAGLEGAGTYYYKNINRMGNVMNMAAYGPPITSVLENAGIDVPSVKRIRFVATDDYSAEGRRGFEATLDWYLQERYYYPNLKTNTGITLSEDGKDIIIDEGVLDGAGPVPIILAVKASKTRTDTVADPEKMAAGMRTDDMFRLCIGQHALSTGANNLDAVMSSYESVHSIGVIDVTLDGSPVKGMDIEAFDTDLKVGSKKQLTLAFSGEEGFEELLDLYKNNLKWSSDRSDIVSVDKNGMITVLKEGKATITVTANVGGEELTAQMTINGEPGENTGGGGTSKKDQKKTKKKSKSTSKNKSKEGKKSKSKDSNGNNTQRGDNRQNTSKQQTSVSNTTTTGSKATEAQGSQAKKTISVREVSLSELPTITREEMMTGNFQRVDQLPSEDANAMGEVKEFGKAAAAGTGGAALLVGGAGAFLRIRRFWRDTM